MLARLVTPTRLQLEGFDEQSLRTILTYHNRSARYEYKRFRKRGGWYANQHGMEAYQEELARLKAAQQVCLLFSDEGGLWTHPGLLEEIRDRWPGVEFRNEVDYPEPRPLPWFREPAFRLRPYQQESVDKLLKVKHGAVELCTGSGKSAVITHLCKTLGLKTVIMAPTESIWLQLLKTLRKHLGEKHVGAFGAGKKQLDRLITVGIAASLTRIEPGTPAWEDLSKARVFITDESHLLAAKTFDHVATGLCADAPYRFSFSGTQERGDGAELLLRGLIGPVQVRLSLQEAVEAGYLARPRFKMFRVKSKTTRNPKDPKRKAQAHFYENPEIYKRAAACINYAIGKLDHQVLVLIEEIPQFARLLPYLKYRPGFAHGGNLSGSAKDRLPEEWHKSDPEALVDAFNEGKLKLLVGTSCVNTGTDFLPVNTLVNLQGGTSSIRTKQSVGRGTRKVPGKEDFTVIDFIVRVPVDETLSRTGKLQPSMIERHCWARHAIYTDLIGEVEVLG